MMQVWNYGGTYVGYGGGWEAQCVTHLFWRAIAAHGNTSVLHYLGFFFLSLVITDLL